MDSLLISCWTSRQQEHHSWRCYHYARSVQVVSEDTTLVIRDRAIGCNECLEWVSELVYKSYLVGLGYIETWRKTPASYWWSHIPGMKHLKLYFILSDDTTECLSCHYGELLTNSAIWSGSIFVCSCCKTIQSISGGRCSSVPLPIWMCVVCTSLLTRRCSNGKRCLTQTVTDVCAGARCVVSVTSPVNIATVFDVTSSDIWMLTQAFMVCGWNVLDKDMVELPEVLESIWLFHCGCTLWNMQSRLIVSRD